LSIQATIPDPSYSNVRRWRRYKLDVPVRLIVSKENKVSIVQGRGNELNDGGMAVFAGVELRIDETVSIEFTPPYTGQPIRVRGRVCDRDGYRYGIEFLLETEDDRESVGQLRAVLAGMGTRI
jgi:hypothetical protein